MAAARRPLTFRWRGSDFTFATDAVKSVILEKHQSRTRRRPTSTSPEFYSLFVNGTLVYRGGESTARKHHAKALAYVK